MSLVDYDKAIFKKLGAVYPSVFFASPEEAFKVNAKCNGGKVRLPFIALWRMQDFTLNRNMLNDVMVRRGGRSKPSAVAVGDVMVHGVPVTLTYQVDVYATKREACDGLTAELMMELMEQPWVDVVLSGVGDRVAQFNLELDDSVSDNTSISEFEDTGRFYRLSLTLILNEALIYRVSQSAGIFEVVEVSIEGLDPDALPGSP